MKEHLKYSGVKAELPALTPEDQAWNFDFRPGGWVVATRELNGKTERRRFFYQRNKDRFFAKFIRPSGAAAINKVQGSASDFYGQKIAASRAGDKGVGANDFTAQFPGKVRKILVQEGTTVDAGAPILMVEAMKMEFAIKSEARGQVKKLLVQEGQQLAPGQKLLEFEVEVEGAKK